MCLLFPSIFTNHWWLFALAVIAFAILFVTYKTNQLASVHQTKRYSVGSVLFPIPVYLCFFLAEKQNENLYFYLPVSLLTISDTAAEIAGNFWERQTVKFFGGQKTLAGSLSFFITAIGVSLLWLNTLPGLSTYQAIKVSLIIAAFTTITEAVTLHGWDNLSVPAITVFILLLFLTNPHQSL